MRFTVSRSSASTAQATAREDLDQAELDVVDGEAALRVAVEFPQHLGGPRRLRPAQGEAIAAARDRDIQSGFDLPQVLVQRAAKIGEALVVDRGEDELEGAGLQEPRPRRGPRRAANARARR